MLNDQISPKNGIIHAVIDQLDRCGPHVLLQKILFVLLIAAFFSVSQTTSADTSLNISQNGEMGVFYSLIDPYGVVTDAAGQPVSGVNMNLYWADTALNRQNGHTPDTLVILPELLDFTPNQNHNPQVTNAAGEYAWMIFPDADYYIVATKLGYNDYSTLDAKPTVPAANGSDSNIQEGIIHVGQNVVEFNFSLTKPVLPESMISPTIASFDKYPGAASNVDIATTLTLNSNTLSSIASSAGTLVPATDYIVSGNVVTIKKEYLAAQSVGTLNLTFTFSAGAAKTLSVMVSDSTPPPAPTGLSAIASYYVTINGQKQEGITTSATTTDNGRTVLTVTIDASKLSGLLSKEEDKPVLAIVMTSTADKLKVVLTGDTVQTLVNKQALLEVRTPYGEYELPAEAIEIDRLSTILGNQVKLSDILVDVDIAKSENAIATLLQSTAEKGRFTLMTPPVDFTVTATYKGKTANLDKFASYVKHGIPLPDGVDPSKVTTAIVLEADGTARHVPTYLTLRDGKYYEVASSLTNSTYSLIWHTTTFADVEGHWAQASVNDMASRMVISGTGEGTFNPDKDITRAEFEVIIVRALGLKQESSADIFSDVKRTDWYSGFVQTAYSYKLTSGFEDGTFRPMDKITREQAMVVIARAMKLTGLQSSNSLDVNLLPDPFVDKDRVSEWAKDSIAQTLSSEIVFGKSGNRLAPKDYITRAEVAAMVQRLLKKSGLI